MQKTSEKRTKMTGKREKGMGNRKKKKRKATK